MTAINKPERTTDCLSSSAATCGVPEAEKIYGYTPTHRVGEESSDLERRVRTTTCAPCRCPLATVAAPEMKVRPALAMIRCSFRQRLPHDDGARAVDATFVEFQLAVFFELGRHDVELSRRTSCSAG